jgi:hypothetical protein
MPVAIICANADHPDHGISLFIEPCTLVCGAMMRDLDYVDAGHGASCEDLVLHSFTEVGEKN